MVILFIWAAITSTKGGLVEILKTMLLFIAHNWVMILFVTLLLTFIMGIIINLATRVMIKEIKNNNDRIKKQADIRALRFGVKRN